VIGNQNTNDVYSGATRGQIAAWESPPVPGGAAVGSGRITLSAAPSFPASYGGGRFQVVAATEQSVFYVCDGAGNLMRLVRPFNAAYPVACPSTVGAVPLATNVSSCNFTYDPAHGATQQSGFVWMQIALTSGGETISLAYGAHVSNVP
jgi:MSHA biogenesis protein MshO